MDLETKIKLLMAKELELDKREKELNQREKDLKIGLAFINCNSKYLLENYNEYPDIDTQQIQSITQ
jgi:hypothetical protein